MLVLLDAGNTALSYALYDKGRILKHGSLLHHDIPKFSRDLKLKGDCCLHHVILSSVVPKVTRNIRKAFKGKPCHVWVAGQNLPLPVRHHYPKGQKPGTDRLINAYGASRLYRGPVLILDFGTALTVDYVSRKGVFEGGMIIPGPQIAFQALAAKGAQLPKNIRLPKKSTVFLGKSTHECMNSGILEGFGALADGLVERFRKRYGPLKVLATGGFALTLKPYTRHLKTVDPHHTLKSLLLLFRDTFLRK